MSPLSQRKYLKRHTASRRRLGLKIELKLHLMALLSSCRVHRLTRSSVSQYHGDISWQKCVRYSARINPPGLPLPSCSKTKGVRPSSLRRFSKPHRLHEFIRFTRVLNMIRKRRRHKGTPALDTLNPFYNITESCWNIFNGLRQLLAWVQVLGSTLRASS
jgi:hypothetical protein